MAQTQFPGLMEAANWLGIRGLCTEEETEEDEVGGSREEVTVTTNGTRKRQHSDESDAASASVQHSETMSSLPSSMRALSPQVSS